MTHRSAVLAGVGIWTLLFAAPFVSRADTVLFTNFGASFSYDTSSGNPIGNAFDGNLYAEGDSFTPSSSAKVSSIYLALSCAFVCPDSFTVSLALDAGDQPGASLESFTVPGGSLGLLGASNAPLVLTSIAQPSLTMGTRYWMTVRSDSNDSIAWNLNLTGDTSDEALSADGGATWFSPSGEMPGALEVNGVTTASVPEPATFLLLVSGLLLMAPGRRFGIPARG